MEQATRTRRGVLGGALVLAAGAFGLANRRSGSSPAAVLTPEGRELRLYGRNFHLQAPSRVAGQVPVQGERHSGYGELLDRPGGKVVGHFTAAHLTHDSPFAVGVSSLEIHTFTLPDGTLHGLGLAARNATGSFVILGGTGRYSGAQGTYVAHQRQRELGGDGTAEFQLTFAA